MTTPLLEALKDYGLAEIPGDQNNVRIMQIADSVGAGEWYTSEDLSWCGVFLAYCFKRAGYLYPKKFQTAREWLKTGDSIEVPDVGDVVVFWREDPMSWKGHVGLFVSENDDKINVLGGNQSNRVSIAAYSKARLLGYRTAQRKLNSSKRALVTAELLNIRSKPTATSNKVAKPLIEGTLLEVLDESSGWAFVRPEIEGWVSKHYIKG